MTLASKTRQIVFIKLVRRPGGLVLKHIAIGARGLGFDTLAGHVGHSVAYGSPPLRRFFGAVLLMRKIAEMDPDNRYTLRRNNTSIMKIFLLF